MKKIGKKVVNVKAAPVRPVEPDADDRQRKAVTKTAKGKRGRMIEERYGGLPIK